MPMDSKLLKKVKVLNLYGRIEGEYNGKPVRVRIRASPDNTRIFIDGEQVSNVKQVVIRADVYDPENQMILYIEEDVEE